MAYNLISKDGQVLAKILQFVATDDQVNVAITQYLHENGVSLAEGIDLKKLSENVSKNIYFRDYRFEGVCFRFKEATD